MLRIVVNWLQLTAPPKETIMTRFVAVCLGVMVLSSAALKAAPVPENFTLVERAGEPVWFFVFETSVGKFWIRRDGMGEIGRQSQRHGFYLKRPSKNMVERLYFLEHEGDVFIFYELADGSANLVRVDPVKHKTKWVTPVTARGTPSLDRGAVIIAATEISKDDGRILRQD
jgi:hypothetical protein